MRAIAFSTAAAAALVLVYLALGGASYAPAKAADPCTPRDWREPKGVQAVAEQIVLSGIDGAACKLGVSREQLGLAFTSKDRLKQFQKDQGFSDGQIQDAARAGILRAVDDAERSAEISGFEAIALRLAARVVPVDRLIELVQQGLGG